MPLPFLIAVVSIGLASKSISDASKLKEERKKYKVKSREKEDPNYFESQEHIDKVKIVNDSVEKLHFCRSDDFYSADDLPVFVFNNAKEKFGYNIDSKKIIGFFDDSMSDDGGSGYILTDTAFYYKESLSQPGRIYYDDIKEIKLKVALGDWKMELVLDDGTSHDFYDGNCIGMKSMSECITELKNYIPKVVPDEDEMDED